MMDYSKFIPKDKFDFESFSRLMILSEDEIKPILPELLSWIADMNWSIAPEMVKVLVRFPNSIVPLIKEILKPTEMDDEWKYFIITDLIPKLPEYVQELLFQDIIRIIECPTDGEVLSELVEVAKEYKEKFEKTSLKNKKTPE